jgi:hypothetical protein
MAISYINSATGTNAATYPSFLQDDIAIVFAFRDGSATPPSLSANFTNINTRAGTLCASRICWRRLVTGDTATGTFTNATSVIVGVYRGCVESGIPVTVVAQTSGTTNNPITYSNTAAFANQDGSSWAICGAGHRNVDTTLETAPTGMTNRANVVDATDEASLHDTNGGVSSWSSQTVNIGGTDGGWCTMSIELQAHAPLLIPILMDTYRRRRI